MVDGNAVERNAIRRLGAAEHGIDGLQQRFGGAERERPRRRSQPFATSGASAIVAARRKGVVAFVIRYATTHVPVCPANPFGDHPALIAE